MWGISIVVIQVYLPSTNHNIETFKGEVDKLSDLCAMFSADNHLIVMGDCNARCTSNGDRFVPRPRDNYLYDMANAFNLSAATETDSCGGASYTFYPYGTARPSRIDHVLIDESLLRHLIDCRVLPDAPLNVSRHLPLYFRLSINLNSIEAGINSVPFNRVIYLWKKPCEVNAYVNELSELLQPGSVDYSNV